MPRLTDANALINDVIERYCKDCERRKGIKNGKQKFVYDIGEVPCRACPVDDMQDELENAPTVEVVRCKDCKHRDPEDHKCDSGALERAGCIFPVQDDYFCAWGERRDE